ECHGEGRWTLVTTARGSALGEGKQHPDAELEYCGVARAERDDFTSAGPRRSHDGVGEWQRSCTQDDGFAIAVCLASRLPSGSVRLEQEPPEWVHGERELKDQVAERIQGSDVLGLMRECAREH